MLKNHFQNFVRIPATLLFLLIVAFSTNAQYKGAKSVPPKWRKGFQSITAEEARNLLGVIAGPDFQGRAPAQAGYPAAAGFAASYFRRIGAASAEANNSYFQRFSMVEAKLLPESVVMQSADGALRLEFGKDFTFRAAEDFDTKAQFAFVRLPKNTNVKDLDLTALKGKIVIISPDVFTENREAVTQLNALSSTIQALSLNIPIRSGAPLGESLTIQRVKDIPPVSDNKLIFFRITTPAADKIAESCGATNYLDTAATRASIEVCRQDFTVRAKTTNRELYETMNVVAKIEGSDPALKSEAIVIGAHLDHFGVRNNVVSPGADDNGSGVTAALLIAQALNQNPVKPARSVIIALWSGEELGTLGSRYYVNFPLFPLDKTIAYLNLDMVGRNEEDKRFNEKPENNTTSVYTGSVKFNSEDLYKTLYEMNNYVNLRLKDDYEDRVLRSDTANFYNRNIPTLKTFTGEHADYHKPSDTPDKINYEKLSNIAKWIYLTTMKLSEDAQKPRFEKKPFVSAPIKNN